MKSILFVLFVLSAGSAFAATDTITCTAKGKKLAQNGSSTMLLSDSELTFNVKENSEGVRTLTDISGEVKVSFEVEDPSEELNNDNSYVGIFSKASIKENTEYNPRKYKNFSQFPDFDAYKTTGSESGMWGQFLLEKSNAKKLSAKYIMQAGDHMGGTLHFNCKR